PFAPCRSSRPNYALRARPLVTDLTYEQRTNAGEGKLTSKVGYYDTLAVGIDCRSGRCRPRGVLLADHLSHDRRAAYRRDAGSRSCACAGRTESPPCAGCTESRARAASRVRLTDVALCARSCARRTVCS